MWKDPNNLDKYQYVKTNPYIIRIIGVLGCIAVLLMTYGFINFIQINVYIALIFTPIIAITIINKFIRFAIQIFYPRFDIQRHKQFIKNYWENNPQPKVDIFLPYAGEDLNIHEEVVKASVNMNYQNYKVYMLDDSTNPDHKRIADKYNCVHLSRPNKGEWKKSGNLEYGYTKSSGKYIFILDADFVPHKDALYDLIPYIESDKKIGILQTPQYFEQTSYIHKKSRIEYGGGNIVEDFYRIIQPCRDEFYAATCVGTSAIYKRSAIEKLEGTPKVEASEDLATGLLITQFGYYVKYLPLIVSIGTSPDTYQGYFKQHQRWCSGNLVFAQLWPKAKMNLVTRIIFLMSPAYYLGEALSIIFAFQFLILLYFSSESLSIFHTLYFLPYFVVNQIIIPMTKINKSRPGTRLAALNNSYTYLYTFISLLAKNIPQWHPTGLKFNGLHKDFLSAHKLGVIISSIYILSFIYVLISKPIIFGNYNTYIILAWSFYTVFWHTIYLSMVGSYIHPIKLASVSNIIEKVRTYIRSHSTVALFSVLCAAFTYNFYMSAQDPNTITRYTINQIIAGKSIFYGPTQLNQTAEAATDERKAVLAATVEFNKPEIISISVNEDDTAETIALMAIKEFMNISNYHLAQDQMLTAAQQLSNKITLNENTVDIETDIIEDVISKATEI